MRSSDSCTAKAVSSKDQEERLHLSVAPTTARMRGLRTTNSFGKITTPKALPGCKKSSTRYGRKGFPLSEFIVKQLGRLGERTVIEHVGTNGKKTPSLEPVLAEVPTATELFGFWDHQKYFISLGFRDT